MKDIPIPKVSWKLHKDRNFSVEIVCWHNGISYNWNVYANIFDSHPLFKSTEGVDALPMHYGITYDQLMTCGFVEKKYDWQKDSVYRVIGSDYRHLYDHYDEHSPADGIPSRILNDAHELIAAMLEFNSAL